MSDLICGDCEYYLDPLYSDGERLICRHRLHDLAEVTS